MCSEGVPAVPKYRVLHGSLGSFWRHQWLVGFRGTGQKGRPSISQYFAAWTTGNTCSKAYMPWSAVRSRSRPDFQSAELPYSNVKKWRVQSADESPYFILGPSLASSASPPSPPSPTCPVLGTCSPLSAPVPLR